MFKNDPRPPYPTIYDSDLGLYEFVREYQARQFIQHDRPAHLDMRKVVHGYFTPRSMEEWRPMVQDVIKDLLDEAEERGSMDVMRDFATPLPLLIIAEMMGVPKQDRPYIREVAEKLLYVGRGEPWRMQNFSEGIREMIEYVTPLVEKRIVDPEDDFISVLAQGEREGVFSREQVISNSSLLLLAGHETTINLLCNGILSFIRNPDQYDLLRSDIEGMHVKANEECLRHDSSVKSITRIAAEDVELRDQVIKKDERIRWFISSANRDPRKFENPDDFDITRWPNPHVAFGAGIHHCLGATLVRVEGQEAFKAFAERFESLHLDTTDDQLEYQPSITFRSLKSLPITWN